MIALALKDPRILFRNKGRIFFTFIWPIIVTVLFGLAFGGGNDPQSKPRVAIVDEDNTDGSRAFIRPSAVCMCRSRNDRVVRAILSN